MSNSIGIAVICIIFLSHFTSIYLKSMRGKKFFEHYKEQTLALSNTDPNSKSDRKSIKMAIIQFFVLAVCVSYFIFMRDILPKGFTELIAGIFFTFYGIPLVVNVSNVIQILFIEKYPDTISGTITVSNKVNVLFASLAYLEVAAGFLFGSFFISCAFFTGSIIGTFLILFFILLLRLLKTFKRARLVLGLIFLVAGAAVFYIVLLVPGDMKKIRNAYDAGNYKEAFSLTLPLAEKGNGQAQYLMGFFYENGTGIEKNLDKALEWYEKSTESNNASGQTSLADIYFKLFYTGKATQEDKSKAIKLYQEAAEQNYIPAQIKLAGLYVEGTEISQNLPKAYYWDYIAAKNGSGKAEKRLSILEKKLTDKEKKAVKAEADNWIKTQTTRN